MDMNDRTDIEGIHNMIKSSDIDSNIDLKEIEKKIINGDLYVDDVNRKSASQRYKETMQQLMKGTIQIDNESPRDETTNVPNRDPSVGSDRDVYNENYNNMMDYHSVKSHNDRRARDTNSYYDPNRSEKYDQSNYNQQKNYYQQKTKEEERQAALKQFLNLDKEEPGISDKYELDHERLVDDKVYMVEQIDDLIDELQVDRNDSRYRINDEDNYDTVRTVWERLQYKSQLRTYNALFNEAILLLPEVVEHIFDGKKEYFGYKPCMTGWSDTVKIKLRQMKPQTSKVVSGLVQNYKIGEASSIIFQLFLSGVLYSQTRRKENEEEKYGKKTTDREWKNSLHAMDDE